MTQKTLSLLLLSLLLVACGNNDDDNTSDKHDATEFVTAQADAKVDEASPEMPLITPDYGHLDKQTRKGEHIVKVLYAKGTKRVYLLKNGTQETRTRGTRAWRNNNEGNLEFGKFAKKYHAVGKDSRFAIFPSEYLGLKAKERLLFFTGSYKNLSLFKAIHRYAPSVENNTSWYYRSVKNAVGVDKPMHQYNDQQRKAIIRAMRKVEGWREGKTYRHSPTGNKCRARALC